ncbi:hypothetical protein MSIMFI_04917 [Mycobacterium simulans]|uniref:hypothetical protein n=1 Tax=Mycobacterium simulans TaxID=627089 RepID=UPI00174B480E|nr:hypothetical protein [Mycobacterium simulans]SON63387.1 hypothetical protein MSIMFI_04917 [Mycobacterium simulans]
MAATICASDPSLAPSSSWRGRRASLLSHGATVDDPRVRECDQALAYLKVRRVIDAQRGRLATDHIPALVALLQAVTA